MFMKKKLYIHLGYPRTGTKTLQTHFFPNHKDINYLGRHPKKRDLGSPHIDIINTIMILPDSIFEINKNSIINEVKKLPFVDNKINVISSEFFILSEFLYDGSYQVDKENKLERAWFQKKKELNYKSDITVERTITRLKSILEEIEVELKVFFSIREQSSEIISLYVAAAPESGSSFPITAEFLVGSIKKNVDNPFIKVFIETFNYYSKHSTLSKLVGENNLKVLVYEDLKYNKKFFLEEISNFLGIDLKVSIDLMKDSIYENSENYLINEKLDFNSPQKVILNKLIKNLFKFKENLKINNLKNKIKNFLILIRKTLSKKDDKNHFLNKKKLINSKLILEKNTMLVKMFYKHDNFLLDKKNNLNLKKYGYY